MEATNREFELLMRAKLEQQELINELEQQLLLSQKREMDLREALQACRKYCRTFELIDTMSLVSMIDKALSTPSTLDDLYKWRDAEIEKAISNLELETSYCIDGDDWCSELEDIAEDMQEGETTTLYTWKHTKLNLIEYKKDTDGNLYALRKAE
jgi:hypothetical protein